MPHTPRPWNMQKREPGDKTIFVSQPADGYHRLRAEIDCDDCDTETAEANARLIAAAPELYEACKKAAYGTHHPACKCKREYSANPERYCTCWVAMAQAAIAKAEGRPA